MSGRPHAAPARADLKPATRASTDAGIVVVRRPGENQADFWRRVRAERNRTR